MIKFFFITLHVSYEMYGSMLNWGALERTANDSEVEVIYQWSVLSRGAKGLCKISK